jgi:glycine/D-amino acid oxidase-like deaminating enzyme
VVAAQKRGVEFHFGQAVESMNCKPVDAELQPLDQNATLTNPGSSLDFPNSDSGSPQPWGVRGAKIVKTCQEIQTTTDRLAVDWVVIAAGLGSTPLTAELQQALAIRPVLGQALHLRLDQPLAPSDRQPVITGNDVHIVPLKNGEYWVGATVEFPVNGEPSPPDSVLLEGVLQQAIAFCPALAKATVLRTWSGLRPRPENRPAPVIDSLPGYRNVLLATGHYRNGVLLAPATAQIIREMITAHL